MLNASLALRRLWITPGPHKGWNPEIFEHMGKAMQLARVSKHFTHNKLAIGTGISPRKLRFIEKGWEAPTDDQRRAIERWLGVNLVKHRKSYVERALLTFFVDL
jgi:ribosome-binding protein aMBF1 (putative translation factor)